MKVRALDTTRDEKRRGKMHSAPPGKVRLHTHTQRGTMLQGRTAAGGRRLAALTCQTKDSAVLSAAAVPTATLRSLCFADAGLGSCVPG